jgi:hypothetical protein
MMEQLDKLHAASKLEVAEKEKIYPVVKDMIESGDIDTEWVLHELKGKFLLFIRFQLTNIQLFAGELWKKYTGPYMRSISLSQGSSPKAKSPELETGIEPKRRRGKKSHPAIFFD